MTAKEIASTLHPSPVPENRPRVEASAHAVDLLPVLLDSPEGILDVVEEGRVIGTVDAAAALRALGSMFPARDDCSMIVVECDPANYSASMLSHAVESADAHLVGPWPVPAADGRLQVTLRVKMLDPEPAVRSLERYGFEVVSFNGRSDADFDVAAERLSALQAYLNV